MTSIAWKKILFADDSRHLVFWLCIVATVLLMGFPSLPVYTRWAFILLFLPSVFFIFRREAKFDHKALLLVWVLTIFGAILWDKIAYKHNLWYFPATSVSGYLLGIPYEEYIWGLSFTTIAIGIYTSLPKFRHTIYDGPRFQDIYLLCTVFVLDMLAIFWVFSSGTTSYFKWLLVIAILPSLIFLWRKGEKIDEVRLILTIVLFLLYFIWNDHVFILTRSWGYNESALIGRVGIVPIDDILFGFFHVILCIGFYTSLQSKTFKNKRK
jgi:lycopene cyclase domain-containing protein